MIRGGRGPARARRGARGAPAGQRRAIARHAPAPARLRQGTGSRARHRSAFRRGASRRPEDLLNVAPPAPRRPARACPRGCARATHAPRWRAAALLVGQSLVERILLKRLRKYELSVDWCREPAQAQAMLKAHPSRLVVIDRLGGEPDAFQVSRWAKQAKGPKGAATVILFAPSAGSMERMKAGLAGADAYLSLGERGRPVQGAGPQLVNQTALRRPMCF